MKQDDRFLVVSVDGRVQSVWCRSLQASGMKRAKQLLDLGHDVFVLWMSALHVEGVSPTEAVK